MRLMKTKDTGNEHSSPCSKAELLVGVRAALGKDAYKYPALERCTRAHLIDIAGEIGVLVGLEERASIIRILKGAKIDFDSSESTYELVARGIDIAVERYGIADLDALGKNLKKSPFREYKK